MAGGCRAIRPSPPLDIAVHVSHVAINTRSGEPLLTLQETGGARTLQLWIGFAEATSIAAALQKIAPPRPNGHDLSQRLIEGLKGKIERVVVTELRDETYFALLVVTSHGRRIEIDARPSDAIAVGIRAEAPLFVREPLLERSPKPPQHEQREQEARSLQHPLTPAAHRQLDLLLGEFAA